MKIDNKRGFQFVALVAVLFGVGPVFAGQNTPRPVTIVKYGTNYGVSGSLGTARNSVSNDSIGCTVFSEPTSPFAVCSAKNAQGQVGCYTFSKSIVEDMKRINSDSYVSYYVNMSSSECFGLQIGNDSSYEPKR